MTASVAPYAKISVSGLVIGIELTDGTGLDPDFTWVDLTGTTCSDGTPVVYGCSYAASTFSRVPRDSYGRTVTIATDGMVDAYTVTNAFGGSFVVAEPVGTDQATVYAAINATLPLLAVAKQQNLRAFNDAVLTYNGTYFTTEQKLQFFIIFYLAQQGGLSNRAAYILPLLTWANSVISYASSYAAAITAMTDVGTVLTTVWDIPGNTLAVPSVTLAVAISINN